MPKVGFHIDTGVGVNGDQIEMSRKSSQYSQKENPHQGSSGSEISTMSKECKQASTLTPGLVGLACFSETVSQFDHTIICDD